MAVTRLVVTRVVVAHDAGARWFDNRGPGKGLVQRGEVEFEDGRRHQGELDADRPGSAGGGRRHAYAAPSSRDTACAHFARSLATDLARELRAGDFSRLVLIAPPRFLGVLKSELDPLLERALLATIAKDLPRASVPELITQLGPHIAC